MLNARYFMRLKQILTWNGKHLKSGRWRERKRKMRKRQKKWSTHKNVPAKYTHTHSSNSTFDSNRLNFFLAPVCADAVARERFTCNMLTMIFSVRCIIFSMVATVATAIVIAMFVRLLISLQIIVYQSSA